MFGAALATGAIAAAAWLQGLVIGAPADLLARLRLRRGRPSPLLANPHPHHPPPPQPHITTTTDSDDHRIGDHHRIVIATATAHRDGAALTVTAAQGDRRPRGDRRLGVTAASG